jgi:hypothetical protein
VLLETLEAGQTFLWEAVHSGIKTTVTIRIGSFDTVLYGCSADFEEG